MIITDYIVILLCTFVVGWYIAKGLTNIGQGIYSGLSQIASALKKK